MSTERIYTDIRAEVFRAETGFPEYNSSHEGYAIIAEELDELWELVRGHNPSWKEQYKEAKQIACTAIRFMKMCQKHDMELQ